MKTDAPDQYRIDVISDYQEGLAVTEPKGAYSYSQVSGAHLVLYKAKRIYTTDSENYPKGYYLVKAENNPAQWTVENSTDNTPVTVTADWITDGTPKYFEGIPAGDYILQELEAASGYVRSSMELTIKAAGDVQTVNVKMIIPSWRFISTIRTAMETWCSCPTIMQLAWPFMKQRQTKTETS